MLYTGAHLQLTMMSLAAGESIGWEMHDHLDQFLRIEQAVQGTLKLGPSAQRRRRAAPGGPYDWAIDHTRPALGTTSSTRGDERGATIHVVRTS